MADKDVAAELQHLQRQLQSYDRHLAGLEQSLGELQSAIATLKGIQGSDAMNARVPVGAGVRIDAQVDPTKPVMLDIGGGYTTESTVEDALSKLQDRLQTTEAAFRTASGEAEKVGLRLQQLQAQA